MRFLTISASESLPRLTPEVCSYEATWPYLLRSHGEVVQLAIGAATIADLFAQASTYFVAVQPDVVILQSGLADCAPRALTRTERRIIEKFGFTRRYLGPLVRRNTPWLRARRGLVYTGLADYYSYLHRFRKLFSDSKFLALGILTPVADYEKRVPGLTRNVVAYNQALSEVFHAGFVDTSSAPSSSVMSDFMHLTAGGHAFLFAQIEQRLGIELVSG